nr:hypothetical protein [Acidithiobacillus ferrivorans]
MAEFSYVISHLTVGYCALPIGGFDVSEILRIGDSHHEFGQGKTAMVMICAHK